MILRQEIFIPNPAQTPKHDGVPVGLMRRFELYRLCQQLNLPVHPNMNKWELVAVYTKEKTDV